MDCGDDGDAAMPPASSSSGDGERESSEVSPSLLLPLPPLLSSSDIPGSDPCSLPLSHFVLLLVCSSLHHSLLVSSPPTGSRRRRTFSSCSPWQAPPCAQDKPIAPAPVSGPSFPPTALTFLLLNPVSPSLPSSFASPSSPLAPLPAISSVLLLLPSRPLTLPEQRRAAARRGREEEARAGAGRSTCWEVERGRGGGSSERSGGWGGGGSSEEGRERNLFFDVEQARERRVGMSEFYRGRMALSCGQLEEAKSHLTTATEAMEEAKRRTTGAEDPRGLLAESRAQLERELEEIKNAMLETSRQEAAMMLKESE
eukprot:64553-Hanusia_phi.AAC.6